MLMKADRGCLLVIDVQEKLARVMDGIEPVTGNIRLLIRAAARLGVPVLASEQYPEGIGPTVAALAPEIPGPVVEKMTFSCLRDDAYRARFEALGRSQAVITGIETHVCVTQTAMELLERGLAVFLVADATTSRTPANRERALARLARAGAEIVTTEMVLFEWLGRAGTPEFRDILKLVK